MNYSKRIASMLVLTSIGFSALAGCGKQATDTGAVKTEESKSSFTYTGVGPITDQTGAKVSLLAQNSWYTTVDFATTPIVDELAKRAGVELEWTLVSPTTYQDSVSPMLAAGTGLPDIVQLPDLDPNMNYISAGLFVPLDGYMDLMPNYKKYLDENPAIKASLTAEDGHIYYVPQTVVTQNYQPALMYNMRWLDKLGIEAPTTLDGFVEMLRAFRDNDMNGNGDKTDEVPMSVTAANLRYMFGPAFGLDLVSGFYADEEGKVHYAYGEEENYKEYLAFLNGLYKEGLLEIEFSSLTRDQITERCGNDLTGVTFDFSWQMSTLYSAAYDDYDGETPIFKGVAPLSGKYEGYYIGRNPVSNIFGVTTKSKNIELAIKFLDLAMSEQSQELYCWGIEGESYTITDGVRAFTERAKTDSAFVQGLGINLGCLPSQQSVPATDVLLAKWHVEVDKELQPYVKAPWPFIYSTEEEGMIVSQYLVDVNTYTEEQNIAFITGTISIDAFDNYLATLKNMNIDKLLEVRQNQYNRFLAASK
jgi:putative aldouronate transport system substrate-binding protein